MLFNCCENEQERILVVRLRSQESLTLRSAQAAASQFGAHL